MTKQEISRSEASDPDLDTYHKALAFNMDRKPYGTIAEIGAGQETARWFFKVGGAASTIAKAMSAYDMKFSDTIYGACKRYVSRERLESMLKKEYALVTERLDEARGEECTFFAFANTVATYNYAQKREGHGWLGIRFQTESQSVASQIDLHVILRGGSSTQDQETLGILGVNLIYGAHYQHTDPVSLLSSLMDGLSSDHLEIDMIDFEGPAFSSIDNRLMALYLVKLGLTRAAIFNAAGKLIQPSDALYKKAVLVERSRFRPPTLLTINMLDCAHEAFINEPDVNEDDIVVLSEMTLENLCKGDNLEEGIDAEDFLNRVDILCALGKNVMISRFGEYYRLAQYLFKYTNLPVAVALGIPNLKNVFDESFYNHLEGGILEASGRMFRNDMRMYVCPALAKDGDELTTVNNLELEKNLRHLYQHLVDNNYIRELSTINHDYLTIHSEEVLKKIRCGEDDWKNMVPEKIVNMITERDLFRLSDCD